MWTTWIVTALSIMQAAGGGAPRTAGDGVEAALDRASKAPDLDEAGRTLSSALADESALRSAYSMTAIADKRSIYILFGGHWGPRANITWGDRQRRRRILVESVSAKPELIRSVLLAERYETYHEKRHPRGAATINSFPFFSHSAYADDLVETFVGTLRKEVARPADAIRSPYDKKKILVTAEEMELNLLEIWQLLCGVCGRLDLIDRATTKNWRDRFPDLDQWFQKNRAYILWDERKSCIRLDEEAKEMGRPTPRVSRSIPELKPPWRFGDEPKGTETARP